MHQRNDYSVELDTSNGTEINTDTLLNTLLFTVGQALLLDSEDDLQRALRTLHNTTTQFVRKISPITSKVMSFKGQVPV
jgi:predicted RNA-binding protein associated with RNAse of E/G family